MRSARILAATVLATSGLVVAGVTTQSAQAAGSKNLTVSYSKVVKNETFSAVGTLTTPVERPVRLQFRTKSSGAWTTTKSTTSNSGGYFSFNVSTSKSRYFRFYAPASNGNAKIVGNAKRVTVVSQKVTTFRINNRKQCHFIGDSSNFDTITVFTTFYPARPGREVKVTTEKYGTFTTSQDSDGNSVVSFGPGNTRQSSTVQARTSAANGAPTKFSSTSTISLTNCQLIFIPI